MKGETPSESSPATFQVSGVFDNFYKDQDLTSIPINGKLRVNGLNLAIFRPYLKKMLDKVSLDSVFSVDTRFAGSLGGKMKTEGMLKYHRDSNKESETLRDSLISNSGQLEYKVAIDHDTLNIESLKFDKLPPHPMRESFIDQYCQQIQKAKKNIQYLTPAYILALLY